MKFAICLSNEGYEIDLEPFRVYEVVEDKEADAMGCVRIVDDSGEDYLFAADRFLPLELSAPAEMRLGTAVIAARAVAHRM